MVESGVLVLVLGIAARGAPAGWKMVYLNLMAASALYALDSQVENLAITKGRTTPGSLYDVPLMGAVSWMLATALTAREWQPEAAPRQGGGQVGCDGVAAGDAGDSFSARLLGLWAFRWDDSPALARTFRLCTVLAAMLVLGAFVFCASICRTRR
jgi:hypothetical protein